MGVLLFFLEAPPGIGPGMKVLQTSALPLGYGAIPARKGKGIPSHSVLYSKATVSVPLFCMKTGTIFRARVMERITGLEPATSTLARWRSTK